VPSRNAVRQWLTAGVTVGALDGLFAIVLFGFVLAHATPVRIFQGVAFAVLGKAAIQGGVATGALGLAMHFCVALSWAGAYAIVLHQSTRLQQIVATPRGRVIAGVVLGAIVWLAMDLLILPLTLAVPRPPITSPVFIIELIGHMIIVGPPITLIVRAT
jgi:hypothetical protein